MSVLAFFLAFVGGKKGDFAAEEGGFFFVNAGFFVALFFVVVFGDVDAGDNEAYAGGGAGAGATGLGLVELGGEDFKDFPGLAFVFAGGDDDGVAFFDCGLAHGVRWAGAFYGRLEYLGGEGDDFHEVFLAQLAGDWSEDAGAFGGTGAVEDDDGVGVEAEVASIRAADGGFSADNDCFDDGAFFDGGIGCGVLDRACDDVADAGGVRDLTHAGNHLDFLGTCVVGDV